MTPRLDVFELVVSDMAGALAFYRKLGLDIPAGADAAPHVEVQLPGGLRLLVDTVETIRSFDPSWQPSTGGPSASLGFACDSPDDVNATFKEMVAAGYAGHLEPFDAFWGQRYASLRDPDGHGVDLFAALES